MWCDVICYIDKFWEGSDWQLIYITFLPCYIVVESYYRLILYDPSDVSFRLSQLPVHKSREQISTDSLSNVYLVNDRVETLNIYVIEYTFSWQDYRVIG